MVNQSNFVVRVSGRKENSYYIDYAGIYKISGIAKAVDMDALSVKQKYIANGAIYDEEQDVYYFSSIDSAKKAVSDILQEVKSAAKGKLIFLTEAEIEFIRKALINENINSLHVGNKVKDAIFEKLNR